MSRIMPSIPGRPLSLMGELESSELLRERLLRACRCRCRRPQIRSPSQPQPWLVRLLRKPDRAASPVGGQLPVRIEPDLVWIDPEEWSPCPSPDRPSRRRRRQCHLVRLSVRLRRPRYGFRVGECTRLGCPVPGSRCQTMSPSGRLGSRRAVGGARNGLVLVRKGPQSCAGARGGV